MSGSSDCVMTVVVNINEDEYSNDNERFHYTPDPVFTSVSPQDVIPAYVLSIHVGNSEIIVVMTVLILFVGQFLF